MPQSEYLAASNCPLSESAAAATSSHPTNLSKVARSGLGSSEPRQVSTALTLCTSSFSFQAWLSEFQCSTLISKRFTRIGTLGFGVQTPRLICSSAARQALVAISQPRLPMTNFTGLTRRSRGKAESVRGRQGQDRSGIPSSIAASSL